MPSFSVTITVTRDTQEELNKLRDEWLVTNPIPDDNEDGVPDLSFANWFKQHLKQRIIQDIKKGRIRSTPPTLPDTSDIDGSVG